MNKISGTSLLAYTLKVIYRHSVENSVQTRVNTMSCSCTVLHTPCPTNYLHKPHKNNNVLERPTDTRTDTQTRRQTLKCSARGTGTHPNTFDKEWGGKLCQHKKMEKIVFCASVHLQTGMMFMHTSLRCTPWQARCSAPRRRLVKSWEKVGRTLRPWRASCWG